MIDSKYKFEQNAREAAMKKGEEIALLNSFSTGPVDPFQVISSEGVMILAEGDDFRDCFDGRLSYHNGRFLLIYNTRYNVWPKHGIHHPKVRFTVAHELGHYYLDRHREFLVTRNKSIESFSEFESSAQVEREADAFAAGLLMPQYLLGPHINCELNATFQSIKTAADIFDISLTSMMVRWTQLSDFPCATLCVRNGKIQWGFVSEAFKNCGFWKAMRGVVPGSSDACKFIHSVSGSQRYAEASGTGLAHHWIEGNRGTVDVQEFYIAIPYSQCVMVFLTAEEDDLPYSNFTNQY